MSRFARIVSAFFFLICFAAAARADYLNLNAGYFDALRHKDSAALFGAEYRLAPLKYGLSPIIGGFVTSKGSAYGYAGLAWEIPVWKDEWYIVPNFAPGLYSTGHGKFLGGPVEFRTGIEIDYQFANRSRLGVAFNHMSNADIYQHNPSDENAIVSYSIPIDGGR